jgi:transcriptional regulator of met regulon
MKKLMISLVAINLFGSLSIVGLEKPATVDVDVETYRIEKMRGENPQVHALQLKIEKLKEQARTTVGAARNAINAEIEKYQAQVNAAVKKQALQNNVQVLKNRVNELKEQAKTAIGAARETIKNEIQKYEADIAAAIK